jgi:hypothetical protein
MTSIGGVAGMVLVREFHYSPYAFWPGMGFVFAVCGVVMMLATFKPTEFARFTSLGGTPLLDIARSGSSDQFEAFVQAILQRVEAAHAT